MSHSQKRRSKQIVPSKIFIHSLKAPPKRTTCLSP